MSISLRDRRLELGLTLEQVGEAIGVGKSTVRKYETGFIENMRRDKIVAYARVLKISPLDIIDPDNEIPESVVDDVSNVVSKLTPDRQKKVYAFAKNELQNQQMEASVSEEPTLIAAHLDDKHNITNEQREEMNDFTAKIKKEHEND